MTEILRLLLHPYKGHRGGVRNPNAKAVNRKYIFAVQESTLDAWKNDFLFCGGVLEALVLVEGLHSLNELRMLLFLLYIFFKCITQKNDT